MDFLINRVAFFFFYPSLSFSLSSMLTLTTLESLFSHTHTHKHTILFLSLSFHSLLHSCSVSPFLLGKLITPLFQWFTKAQIVLWGLCQWCLLSKGIESCLRKILVLATLPKICWMLFAISHITITNCHSWLCIRRVLEWTLAKIARWSFVGHFWELKNCVIYLWR